MNGEGWLAPGTTPGDVDARIARPALAPRVGAGWRIGLSVSLLGVLVLLFTVSVLVTVGVGIWGCLLYTSPSPRDLSTSRMPSSA